VSEEQQAQASRALAPRADAAQLGLAPLLETLEEEARHQAETLVEDARRHALQLRESHVQRAIELAIRRVHEQIEGPTGASLLAAAIRTAAQALGETRVRIRARPDMRAAIASALGADPPAVEAWEEGGAPDDPGVVVLSPDRHRMVDMTVGGLLRRRQGAARRAAARVLLGKRDLP
jgi:vacuolar-type H+-ATPase subunit E/Vma4